MGLTRKKLSCSFCGTGADVAARLLGGPRIYICDACVDACNRILEATPGDFAGWDAMPTERLLASLTTAEAAVDGARAVLQAQVEELRRRGASWEVIGNALGVSRQAAWERYA